MAPEPESQEERSWPTEIATAPSLAGCIRMDYPHPDYTGCTVKSISDFAYGVGDGERFLAACTVLGISTVAK